MLPRWCRGRCLERPAHWVWQCRTIVHIAYYTYIPYKRNEHPNPNPNGPNECFCWVGTRHLTTIARGTAMVDPLHGEARASSGSQWALDFSLVLRGDVSKAPGLESCNWDMMCVKVVGPPVYGFYAGLYKGYKAIRTQHCLKSSESNRKQNQHPIVVTWKALPREAATCLWGALTVFATPQKMRFQPVFLLWVSAGAPERILNQIDLFF